MDAPKQKPKPVIEQSDLYWVRVFSDDSARRIVNSTLNHMTHMISEELAQSFMRGRLIGIEQGTKAAQPKSPSDTSKDSRNE